MNLPYRPFVLILVLTGWSASELEMLAVYGSVAGAGVAVGLQVAFAIGRCWGRRKQARCELHAQRRLKYEMAGMSGTGFDGHALTIANQNRGNGGIIRGGSDKGEF